MAENIAEKIFKKYRGMYFHLMREGNGDYEQYRSFCISKEQERVWLMEMQAEFQESYTHAQCSPQFLDSLSKYMDVILELRDESVVWELCRYLREDVPNWDVGTILESTAILFRARMILDRPGTLTLPWIRTVLRADSEVQRRFRRSIVDILIEAEKNAKDNAERERCRKTIRTLEKKGILQIFW